MPRYITPGEEVQFFRNEDDPQEAPQEEVLSEYKETSNVDEDEHEGRKVKFADEDVEITTDDPDVKYTTGGKPYIVGTLEGIKKRNKERIFFLILLIIAFGVAIFFKS